MSSFDRTGGNDDGFTGAHSYLYVDERGEFVIFDALGPGRLNTLWFTSGTSGLDPLDLGLVRLYFDDESAPRVGVDANRVFSGSTPGFPPELVFDNRSSTGGFVSFVPLPFARRLRITTTNRASFYSAQYDSFPVGTQLETWTPDEDPAILRALFERAPSKLGTDQIVTREYNHTGAGTIESLRFWPDDASGASVQNARIRITWDDQPSPAVDCPLDMFFGSGLGLTSVRAIAFAIRAGPELESRFPMPFWKGFHLTVEGITGRVGLRIGPPRYRASEAGYFHAAYRSEGPPRIGDDFSYVEYDGAGKLVGTVLTIRTDNPSAEKGWWEGDLRSYADRRRTPAIHGTGHEDDHLGGWSDQFFQGPFTLPMNGEPRADILDQRRPYNGNVTMYRLWSGIPFLQNLRHSVEHGSENTKRVEYSAVTFFYGIEAGRLAESDRISVCDPPQRSAHSYVADDEGPPMTTVSAFEGREYRTAVSACHRHHSGSAHFLISVPLLNSGIYLRRSYDQGAARQRATIQVDGELVGDWYTAEGNSTLRWAERDFFIPPRYTSGKRVLSIAVTPTRGSPPWDVADYRALAVVPSPR